MSQTSAPIDGPRVSLILLAYQQEEFVADAVRSILAQDCAPAEIILSDDHSADNTFEILEAAAAAYDGPHKVRVFRSRTNLGPDHLRTCVERATGDLLVFFHGDDVALPNRARRSIEMMTETGSSLLSVNATIIDGHGRPSGPLLLDEHQSGQLDAALILKEYTRKAHGACLAVDRAVFDAFPAFGSPRNWGPTDHVLPFRAALLGGAYFLNERLVQFRQHDNNLGKSFQDKTRGPEVAKETALSSLIMQRRLMLSDLDYFLQKNEETEDLLSLRHTLVEEILARLDDWTIRRSTLMTAGLRPSWEPKAQMSIRAGTTHKAVVRHVRPEVKRTLWRRAREKFDHHWRRLRPLA